METGLGLPSRSMVWVLEDAQELHLDLDGEFSDLVEEERRTVRELETPDLLRERARVRALLAAEQLALDERRAGSRSS